MSTFDLVLPLEKYVSPGGSNTVSVDLSVLTTVKASAGRLCKALVTTAASAVQTNIYDNATAASGKIIGVIAASAAAGTIYTFDMPALNGITVGATATGNITISYI